MNIEIVGRIARVDLSQLHRHNGIVTGTQAATNVIRITASILLMATAKWRDNIKHTLSR
jgi:hypothetical protein